MLSIPKGNPSPFITAIRLARMRDGNMGQAEEIESLIDLLKASEKVLTIVNDTVWALVNKRKGMSTNYKSQLFSEAYVMLTDALERFVDAKTKRIKKFIDYFQLLAQDVIDESKELKDFEKDWDIIKRELSEFKTGFLGLSTTSANYKEEATNQAEYLRKNVVQTSLPILERLTNLENKMQRRVISMIAFIAQANTGIDSNELYRLLTGEP
jgi:hypothetical protein